MVISCEQPTTFEPDKETWTCDCCGERGRGTVSELTCANANLGFLWTCEKCSRMHPHAQLTAAFSLARSSVPLANVFQWNQETQTEHGIPLIGQASAVGPLCGDEDDRCECCLEKNAAKPYTLLCFGVKIEKLRLCRNCLKLVTVWKKGHAVVSAVLWVLRNGKPLPQLQEWIQKGLPVGRFGQSTHGVSTA